MVFYCRCFSFDDKTTKYETRTRAKSPSNLATGKPNNLRVFTFAELKVATNNFSSAWKIGDGRHGSVYKGMVKSLEQPNSDKIPVAVSYIKGVTKGPKDWLDEVNLLGVVDHPNIVKLVGYCMETNERGIQRLLVYKYMPIRSVRYHLSASSKKPLSWTTRLEVAQAAARGLSYLHEGMDFQIVYRDFSSSKLLLDDQWNATLSDLSVAKIGSVGGGSDEFVGNGAYMAPEYSLTGQVSSKSDVWSYGIFLYELITGRIPLDRNRPQNERNLLEWVRPYVQSKNLQPIIDPRLEGMCSNSMKSAQTLVTIANLCLKQNPRSRLKMSEVLELVNGLIGVPSQVTNPTPAPKKEPVNIVANGVPPQVPNPAPASNSLVPVIPRSKLLKSWSTKVCCYVCLAVST